MRQKKLALGLALLVPSAALLVVAACDSSDGSSGSTGFDGGNNCGDFAPCFDGSANNPDAKAPGQDGGPSDAQAADADPWADADTVCANYADKAGPGPVKVRIRNFRSSAAYLGLPSPSCDFALGFELRDQADAALEPALIHNNRCADLQTSCPTDTCAVNVVTKIGPDGGYHEIGWPGTVFTPRYMAKSCYADAGCATGACRQEGPAPSGTIRVTSYPGFYCDGGTCFDCTNGGDISCTLFGAVGGTSGTATVTAVSYDGGTGTYYVDLVP